MWPVPCHAGEPLGLPERAWFVESASESRAVQAPEGARVAKKPKDKSSKKPRPRTLRRAEERRLRKLIDERLELAAMEPGGNPGRPLEVGSAAIVESRAAALGCAVCDGVLRSLSHDALTVDDVSLRRVRARCVECETEREVWVRILVPLAN